MNRERTSRGEPPPIRIIGLGGSMSTRSSSLAALRLALTGAEEVGAETEIFSVRDLDLPMYRPDYEEPPEKATQLADAVRNAQGMLWSSPLYHGTVTGAFKNALDWMQLLGKDDPPYLSNKVIGLISAAGGVQGLQAVNTMEFIVRSLRGWSVPLVIPIPRAYGAFTDAGEARDPAVARQLRSLGKEVFRASRQFALHGWCDYTEREAELDD